MGLRVENYSLAELHRIAVPGAAPPTLFWVLPVGPWRPRDLEEIWHHFTGSRSANCSAYGLLLVKDYQNRQETGVPVNLSSVGATLTDIIPQGAERFITSSAMRPEPCRLMILSGAYPQPGWGVLIEWRHDIESLEALLKLVITKLRDKNNDSVLNVFEDATHAFHHLQELVGAEPRAPNFKELDQTILSGQSVHKTLAAAEEGFRSHSVTEITVRIHTALGALHSAKSLISQNEIDALAAMHRKRNGAISILSVPEHQILALRSVIPVLLADPSKKEEAFRHLESEDAKRALKASLYALENRHVSDIDQLRRWATATESQVTGEIRTAIPTLLKRVDENLKELLGDKAMQLERYQRELERWTEQIRPAREHFHSAVVKAAEGQWRLGPQFLVELEKSAKEQEVWARSIPWDPARMVGWKLLANAVPLHLDDVEAAAREISPEIPPDAFGTAPQGTAVDGSYFTDYVHYLAASQPRLSARSIAVKFLANLLRANELKRLVEKQGGTTSGGADRAALADSLIDVMGWKSVAETRETPLAACVQQGGNGGFDTAPELSGNDLRIVGESFCKDVIDVLVNIAGFGEPQIDAVLRESAPSYERPRGNWHHEVAVVTMGAAHLVISGLGPLAFPNQKNEIASLAENIEQLSKDLNALSHHRPGYEATAPSGPKIAGLINSILTTAATLLGECPWHLDASVICGDQPKVITGEAWSHSSPTPRLLRVIAWSGAPIPKHALLWNKTRINPVITDPVFIERPGGRGGKPPQRRIQAHETA
jgi:hypothetical protein